MLSSFPQSHSLSDCLSSKELHMDFAATSISPCLGGYKGRSSDHENHSSCYQMSNASKIPVSLQLSHHVSFTRIGRYRLLESSTGWRSSCAASAIDTDKSGVCCCDEVGVTSIQVGVQNAWISYYKPYGTFVQHPGWRMTKELTLIYTPQTIYNIGSMESFTSRREGCSSHYRQRSRLCWQRHQGQEVGDLPSEHHRC